MHPTLACHPRQARKHATHNSHASMPPTQARHSCYRSQHEQHAISQTLIDHKEGSSFNVYLGIANGVPQGPIPGPLFFNINISDSFLEDYSSVNFADDTNPYECGSTLNKVMHDLEITTEKMFAWSSFNNLEAF